MPVSTNKNPYAMTRNEYKNLLSSASNVANTDKIFVLKNQSLTLKDQHVLGEKNAARISCIMCWAF